SVSVATGDICSARPSRLRTSASCRRCITRAASNATSRHIRHYARSARTSKRCRLSRRPRLRRSLTRVGGRSVSDHRLGAAIGLGGNTYEPITPRGSAANGRTHLTARHSERCNSLLGVAPHRVQRGAGSRGCWVGCSYLAALAAGIHTPVPAPAVRSGGARERLLLRSVCCRHSAAVFGFRGAVAAVALVALACRGD